jgi:leucine dehydrogenase
VARTLMERDILYVPDFLANCGGLIHVAVEWSGGGSEEDFIAGAMKRLDVAIETAEAEGSTPIEVAERQALERVEAARGK